MNSILISITTSLLYIILVGSFTIQNVNGQTLNELKEQFPEEDVVFLEKAETITIDYVAETWTIERQVSEKMFFLDKANVYSQKYIYYSSFEEIKDIEAKTLVPYTKGKKTLFKEQLVEDIETKDVLQGSIFYSDHKQKNFVFPAVTNGAKTDLQYTEVIKDPHLLSSYYFSTKYAPVLKSTLEIKAPANIQLTFKLKGDNTENINFKQTESSGIVSYKWQARNLDKVPIEGGAPSSAYYEPHLIYYINQVSIDNGEVLEILPDVNGLYQWYANLVNDVNYDVDKDETLIEIVESLVEEGDKDADKAAKIFQWVQSNIKYIAFEDGLGGFVPREAYEVCSRKYGDCKDMSSLTISLLKIAGIPAYLTWIGTRDRPYEYQDIPSPIVDNHMIITAKIDNKFIFLDATGEYLPFGLPTSFIQGKEALIGIDKDNFVIEKVPVIAASDNLEKESIELKIEGRNLIGEAKATYTNYKKVFSEYAKLRADANNTDKDFFNSFLLKGNNKFTVGEVNEKGFFDRTPSLQIDYTFQIPNYVKTAGNKMYINMNLDKTFSTLIDTSKRKLPIERDYKFVNDFTYNLTIPEGYVIDYVPESMSYQGDLFGFDMQYVSDDKQISLTSKVTVNHLLLENNKFNEWNDMVQKMADAYQEVLVLKQNN